MSSVRTSALLAALFWSLLCGATLLLDYRSGQEHIYEQARLMANTSIERDISFRLWAAKKGGVYVPRTEETPSNPYLKIPERDIVTPSGTELTLLNPAYMTRQVYEQDSASRTAIQGHLTSLNPLRPENRADQWETTALRAFQTGVTEYGEIWNDRGEPSFRFMRPFIAEKACLGCHGDQGYREGDIRGGVSVIVPIGDLQQSEFSQSLQLASGVFGAWVIGLCGIGFSWRRIGQGTRALKHERDNMHLLFEAAPNAMLLFNNSYRVVKDNASFRESYFSAESPCGKKFGEIFRCENGQVDSKGCGFGEGCPVCPIREALTKALELKLSTKDAECVVKGEDAESALRVFLFSVTSRQFDGEEGALLSLTDISQQKQAERDREKMQAQLLQTQKIESIGRLAGGVAHDFNNMLAVIQGNVELALLKLESRRDLKDHLLQIKDAAKRSAGLTSQLLGFARKQPMEPQVLVLNRVIDEMLKILRRLIGEDIALIWKPSVDNPKLLIDPSHLNQILTNLVVNARDAIETTGTLVLKTEFVSFDADYCREHLWCKTGDYVQLSVSDDGAGMTDEVLEHMFEPFYTTKAVDKGTGLGLANVYGIVKQNNGFIHVYSERGHGTTFRIYFPLTSKEVLPESRVIAELPAGGGETILLVEDEEILLEISQRILEEAGYQVIASSDPVAALQLATGFEAPIDLLLTDVIMPQLNGKELADQLLLVQPEIKVLYMSGYAAEIVTTRGLLAEGTRLLQKPFSHEELALKLREVLDG